MLFSIFDFCLVFLSAKRTQGTCLSFRRKMLSKYNKNGIITGLLDSYCLVCESYLRDQNDISLHIDNHDHVRNLESTPYFEKYKDDHIRKVKIGYYCYFCNRLFPTAADVGVHIPFNKQHSYNKGLQSLIRTSDSVIAFGNILISDEAWNSIVGGTCLLCKTQFQSASIHKTSQTHVLNLIKINVDVINNSLYRKIDKETFHCLTCNEVLEFRKFKDHFDSLDHKNKHQKCSDLGIKLNNKAASIQIKEEKPVEETAADAKTNSKSQATCTKTTKNPKENDAILRSTKPMLLKRNESNEPQNSSSCHSSKDDAEIEAFVAKNNMSYRVFCNSCQTYLPPSIKNMKQHVDGANHKHNVTKPIAVVKKKSQDVKKVRTCDFVTSMVKTENMYFKDVVINGNLCVNVLSYILIKSHNFQWKCHSCDSTFGAEEIHKHNLSESHKTSLSETVILVIESEFIREIRAEVYHCGFCDIIESGWDGFQEHLDSVQHRECKNAAQHRLRLHKEQQNIREQMQRFVDLMLAGNDDSDYDSDS